MALNGRGGGVTGIFGLWIVALLLAAGSLVDAGVYFDDCQTPADHPSVGDGNYFNLCIRDEIFDNEDHSWVFTKTSLERVVFNNCTFRNSRRITQRFDEAQWRGVTFNDCVFGGSTGKDVLFSSTSFESVLFNRVTFSKSAPLVFRNFALYNVTFRECAFLGKTYFDSGSLTEVRFENSQFTPPRGSPISRSREISFKATTVRQTYFLDSDFTSTIRIYYSRLADVVFNRTRFNEFDCVSPVRDRPFASEWNESSFSNVEFRGNVDCRTSIWRGLFMENSVFRKNADFSGSRIQDISWQGVVHKNAKGERGCHTLDLSRTSISRGVIWNVSRSCRFDLVDARVSRVNFQNISSDNPSFKDTIISNQEFVESRCCVDVCETRGCKCNIREYSGLCPRGTSRTNVNIRESSCFPSDSTIFLENGDLLRMDNLDAGHRILVGNGLHSDVYFFGHKDPQVSSEFIRIDTSFSKQTGSRPLRLSPGHYLYVNGKLATAQTVQEGDRLRLADGSLTTVISTTTEVRKGIFAPATLHGDLVVDGIVVSSYTDAIHPKLAHALLRPLRLLYRNGLQTVTTSFSLFHTQDWSAVTRWLKVPRGPRILN